MVPAWYHSGMAMNLRLTEEQSQALREVASQQGISMQEAALTAIDEYIARRGQRMKSAIERVLREDQELLDRLSQ